MEYLLYVKLVALNCEMTLILIGTNGLKKGKRAWLYFVDSLAGEHLNVCTPGILCAITAQAVQPRFYR